MKTELDINKLIEETQTLLGDGRLEMAAEGRRNVQVIESENGTQYMLQIVATLIP